MKIDSNIQSLIERAAKADDANDALKYSQAACNVANAMVAAKLLPPVQGVTQ